MPALTTRQEDAINALTWLLDTGSRERAQGRSTATAIALIRHAMAEPGRPVPILEVGSTAPDARNRHLAMLVAELARSDPRLRDRFRVEQLPGVPQRILVVLESLPGSSNWLPPGWQPTLETRLAIPNYPFGETEQISQTISGSEQDLEALFTSWVMGSSPPPSRQPSRNRIEQLMTDSAATRAQLDQARVMRRPKPKQKPPPPARSLWQHLDDD